MAPRELELFAHEPGHATPEVLDVVDDSLKRLGLPLESAHYTDAELQRQISAIGAMGMDDLVAEAAGDAAAADLVFALAERVANASGELAWHGLNTLPRARIAERMVVRAGDDLPAAPAMLLWQPERRTLLGFAFGAPTPPERALVVGANGIWLLPNGLDWRHRPLSGYKTGWLLRAETDAEFELSDSPSDALAEAARRYTRLQIALLCGMLSGAVARVIELAYQHARGRASGGKPLMRHQAVALRLGELSMRGDAMLLLLRQHHHDLQRGRPALAQSPGALEHLCESAAWISRNALQVAAGHGYVEGLLFKTLNEQVRTLVNALAVHARLEPRHAH